jgi:hypothetical protein
LRGAWVGDARQRTGGRRDEIGREDRFPDDEDAPALRRRAQNVVDCGGSAQAHRARPRKQQQQPGSVRGRIERGAQRIELAGAEMGQRWLSGRHVPRREAVVETGASAEHEERGKRLRELHQYSAHQVVRSEE